MSGFFIYSCLLSVLPYRNGRVPTPGPSFALRCSLSVVLRPVLPISFAPLASVAFLEIRLLAGQQRMERSATFVSELVKLRAMRLIWTDFLDNWLPFAVVFFLWCTLLFQH